MTSGLGGACNERALPFTFFLFLARAGLGLVGMVLHFSFDCFISLKTLLVAAASSRRCATTVVSGSIDSLECVLLGKISSKSLYGFTECRCFVPNVVSSILCRVLATFREALELISET